MKTTEDGSKTLYIRDLDESYHSSHGALQEALHVFIKNGLNLVNNCEVNILELGFGTGLNVLVTIDEFLRNNQHQVIHYFTVEKYPVTAEEAEILDYPSLFENPQMGEIYNKIHNCDWEKPCEIVPNFFLTKFEKDFFEIENLDIPKINLVYFDCFGAPVQPDLWEKPLLKIVAEKMNTGGIFTTYASKGILRRTLQELGLKVEKKPGPPGKREMVVAFF